MEKIQFIGCDELEVKEMVTLTKLAKKYHSRAEKMLNNEIGLSVHLKLYRKKGAQKKYSVTCKIMAPTKIYRASSSGWKLNDCMHKAAQKIEHEIGHKVKKSNTVKIRKQKLAAAAKR